MKVFEFELVVDGINKLSEEVEKKLYEAGCDDATLSIRRGIAYLEFSRKSNSLKQALLGAIRNVRKAGYVVLRIDQSDLVTPAEIARRTNRTRQTISNYIAGHRGPGNFPRPAFDVKKNPKWIWSSVAGWMAEHDLLPSDELTRAEMFSIANNALEANRFKEKKPKLAREILLAVG